jgi:hypothetical protein
MTTDTNRALDIGTRAARTLHALWLAAEQPDPVALELARDKALDVFEDVENHHMQRMRELLPAWFVDRIVGGFGLMMATGSVVAVKTVLDVTQAADGSLWLDVQLAPKPDTPTPGGTGWQTTIHAAAGDRCSVAVAHVVCAVELADT